MGKIGQFDNITKEGEYAKIFNYLTGQRLDAIKKCKVQIYLDRLEKLTPNALFKIRKLAFLAIKQKFNSRHLETVGLSSTQYGGVKKAEIFDISGSVRSGGTLASYILKVPTDLVIGITGGPENEKISEEVRQMWLEWYYKEQKKQQHLFEFYDILDNEWIPHLKDIGIPGNHLNASTLLVKGCAERRGYSINENLRKTIWGKYMTLSHVYGISWRKKACIKQLAMNKRKLVPIKDFTNFDRGMKQCEERIEKVQLFEFGNFFGCVYTPASKKWLLCLIVYKNNIIGAEMESTTYSITGKTFNENRIDSFSEFLEKHKKNLEQVGVQLEGCYPYSVLQYAAEGIIAKLCEMLDILILAEQERRGKRSILDQKISLKGKREFALFDPRIINKILQDKEVVCPNCRKSYLHFREITFLKRYKETSGEEKICIVKCKNCNINYYSLMKH